MLFYRYKDRIRLHTFIYLFCLNDKYMSGYTIKSMLTAKTNLVIYN